MATNRDKQLREILDSIEDAEDRVKRYKNLITYWLTGFALSVSFIVIGAVLGRGVLAIAFTYMGWSAFSTGAVGTFVGLVIASIDGVSSPWEELKTAQRRHRNYIMDNEK